MTSIVLYNANLHNILCYSTLKGGAPSSAPSPFSPNPPPLAS